MFNLKSCHAGIFRLRIFRMYSNALAVLPSV